MNAEMAWHAALGQLQMEMPKAAFHTWVKNTEFLSYDPDTGRFTVGVSNAFARDWLENRLTATVDRILAGILNCSVNVEFIIKTQEQPDRDDEAYDEPIPATRDSFIESGAVPAQTEIKSRYTFDNFVVGPNNRLAHAACLAVAENPAKTYNPLFLYGGVGLGKTHLLQAIGNYTRAKGLHVLYVTSEDFTNDLIQSIRTHQTQAFRGKYRDTDVLLVDDIQFIANKEATQEEFFHTFNTLYAQEKQIVLTSDRSPKAMATLEERLRSRFEWGLMADIQPPDLETRMAILRGKAKQLRQDISQDVIEFIARKFYSNIRELEGALNRVLAVSALSNTRPTVESASAILGDLLPVKRDVEPRSLVDAVASVFGVPTVEIFGKSRSADVALPRQVAMYLLREDAKLSLPSIGNMLGGRDHTTVMYACQKIASMLESDNQLRRRVSQIREQVFV